MPGNYFVKVPLRNKLDFRLDHFYVGSTFARKIQESLDRDIRFAISDELAKGTSEHLHDLIMCMISGSWWVNSGITIKSRVELSVLGPVRDSVAENMK